MEIKGNRDLQTISEIPLEIQERVENDFERPINAFIEFIERRGDFPEEFVPFLFRDILHYTKEEIEEIDMKEYELAKVYCLIVFVSRNMLISKEEVNNVGERPSLKGKNVKTIKTQWIRKDILEFIKKNQQIPEYNKKVE